MTGVPRQLRTVHAEQPKRSVVLVARRHVEDDLRRRVHRQPGVLRDFAFQLAGAPSRVSKRNQNLIGTIAFRDRFEMIGDEPAGGTPEEFAEVIRKDSAKWGDVVRRAGARLD